MGSFLPDWDCFHLAIDLADLGRSAHGSACAGSSRLGLPVLRRAVERLVVAEKRTFLPLVLLLGCLGWRYCAPWAAPSALRPSCLTLNPLFRQWSTFR